MQKFLIPLVLLISIFLTPMDLFWSFPKAHASNRSILKKADIYTKVFLGDFESVWKIVLKETKFFPYAFENVQSGYLKTRWIDNTLEEHFFGDKDSDSPLASKIQLLILVKKGFWRNSPAVKISIYKKHRVIWNEEGNETNQERENPWKAVPSDGILEKTILYRIQRQLNLGNQLKNQKKKKEDKN